MSAYFCNDLERTEVLVGEFLGRSGSLDELSCDENFIADTEFRRRMSFGVCWTLIALLSLREVIAKHPVKFIEVSDKCAGPSRGRLKLRVNCKIGVVALVSEEWCDSGGGVWRVVVGKLS